MLEFESYFSFNSIVDQLAQHRAKLSFYVHKNIYLEKYCQMNKWEVKDPYKIADQEFLRKLMPPRKQWCRPRGHSAREPFGSSIDLNKASIKKRVKIIDDKFLAGKVKFTETPSWYQKLRYFVFELKIEVLQNNNITLEKPTIFPAKKKPEDVSNTERRPLAKSFLRDKIVLSIVNKYLTKVFDPLFLNCSFAFRANDEHGNTPTYHQAVKTLKEFRIKHLNTPLYAAECDIKKFFDCLDHNVIKKCYYSHVEELAKRGVFLHPASERVFMAYLEFYSFGRDVYPKNQEIEYWMAFNDHSPKGQFGWVKEMVSKDAFDDNVRIGIPQGGALSGLIVNMVLDAADKVVCHNQGLNEDFIYLRYCDDMVIVHKDSHACKSIFDSYIKELNKLELITHDCMVPLKKYNKEFWNDVKSRDVYLWSRLRDHGYPDSPWISFLGYLVSDKGELKVRKRSLQKQKDKHVLEIRKVIQKLNHQTDSVLLEAKDSIYHSVSHKMASMAIGKVNIQDYKFFPVQMCWAAGFKLIEDNKYVGQQLRLLDQSRQESLAHLRRYLKKRTFSLETLQLATALSETIKGHKDEKPLENKVGKEKQEVVFTKYPHSFYSMLERQNKI